MSAGVVARFCTSIWMFGNNGRMNMSAYGYIMLGLLVVCAVSRVMAVLSKTVNVRRHSMIGWLVLGGSLVKRS